MITGVPVTLPLCVPERLGVILLDPVVVALCVGSVVRVALGTPLPVGDTDCVGVSTGVPLIVAEPVCVWVREPVATAV